MSENPIYESIAKRTGGDIYVGVVGPVRTGKSTFIHNFMESVILPNIENEYDRERTLDEIPQSGSGRTITTTEPKFVPSEAVHLNLDGTEMNVRMIDCVGYMVDGATGATEDGEWRMVITPWQKEPLTFKEAAEIGTEKVAKEHSTIAILVTTDGTIADIPRSNYIPAEERAAKELSEAKKPFAIILNSAYPESENARSLAGELEEKYNVPVALVNCTKLNAEDAEAIIELIVGEFPIREISFTLPEWTSLLPEDHEVKKCIMEKINEFADNVQKFSDIDRMSDAMPEIKKLSVDSGSGKCALEIPLSDKDYYSALSELSGLSLGSETALFSAVIEMAEMRKEYERIKDALYEAKATGYGIVMPTKDELSLSSPEAVKQGNSYGIKLSAEAESIHMIKTSIKADVCPTFGTEEQSEEVIKTLRCEFEDDPKKLLDSKLFGRSLYELVNDGMQAKLMHMPQESREKMGQTIEKIINEGAAGLICILL